VEGIFWRMSVKAKTAPLAIKVFLLRAPTDDLEHVGGTSGA